MNDVGKTNLLYAIKLVFSYKFRNIDLLDSDFHKQNISKPFEIFISMQIFDKEKEEKSDFTEIILSEESIEKIVESEYFKCIKDLINDERE